MKYSLPRLLPVLGLCALAFTGCDLFSFGKSSSPGDAPPKGMVRIAAAGRQTVLGSTSVLAKPGEEAPRMTARFAADFFMDETEVTQAKYESLMGRNPAVEGFGRGGDLPVYNVSWYDAVLYCNARSKRDGLDTVYAYASVARDASGRAYAVEGLLIRYEVRGYRLPTEAEWEFAARAGTESEFAWGDSPDTAKAGRIAWHAGNSGGKVHAAGGLEANAFGLHDMFGNVMEWVNDWKGPYPDAVVEASLGARDPGVVPERVVKGGAFSYDLRYLRFAGRSANYPTLSSASAEYVGFRCVLGAIVNGRYLAGDGAYTAMPPVTAHPSGARLLFGHDQVKLAFVNATSSRRTLAYIDFTERPVTVHEFLDDSTVFNPVISPDGQWVAYGDVDEGDTRVGTVKIRRLATGSTPVVLPVPSAVIPRWWVSPVSSDTFLVFATRARDNLEPAWTSDETYRIRVSGGVAAGDASRLVSGGGYHDGLSSDGRRLASGYRRLHLRDASGSSDRILFTGPANGKPAGDTSQVCNVSLHPDFKNNPQMLLLDFGYSSKSTVVGRPYGLHEILFRLDTSGSVHSWYGAPQGFSAWQDAEWSNHPNYAVGVGENQGQGYPAVVGLYFNNSATSVLASGTTLRQPSLWVRPGAVPVLAEDAGRADSLGKYNDPATGQVQLESSARMKLLWRHRDHAEVVALGSSHITNGIYPPALTRFPTVSLAYAAGGLLGMNKLLMNYVLPQYTKLKAVVLEVHPGYYNLEDGDATWRVNMGQTKGYHYDSTHGFWSGGVPQALDSVMRAYVNPVTTTYLDSMGTNFFPPEPWDTTFASVVTQKAWKENDPEVARSIAYLGAMVQALRNRRVHAILVIVPQSKVYKKSAYYGKFGPPHAIANGIVQKVADLCTGNPYCTFYDAHQFGNHDYPDSMFVNSDHLANQGAVRFSRRIDSLIYSKTGSP